MNVAIAVFGDGIATTLDFAHELLIIQLESRGEVMRSRVHLGEVSPPSIARCIAQMGVQVVICGAISRELAAAIADAGIQVFPLVSGPVGDVIAAFQADRLTEPRFLLPGCTSEDRARLVRQAIPHSISMSARPARLSRSAGRST